MSILCRKKAYFDNDVKFGGCSFFKSPNFSITKAALWTSVLSWWKMTVYLLAGQEDRQLLFHLFVLRQMQLTSRSLVQRQSFLCRCFVSGVKCWTNVLTIVTNLCIKSIGFLLKYWRVIKTKLTYYNSPKNNFTPS